MKNIHRNLLLGAVVIVLFSAVLLAQPSVTPAALLKAAQQRELVDGDDQRALSQYQELVAKYPRDPVVPQTLLAMARIYARLNQPDDARNSYARIVAEFPNSGAAGEARPALSRLTGKQSENVIRPRLICELCGDVEGSVSPDGKLMATVGPFRGGENTGDIGILDLATNKLTPLHIEGSGKEPSGVAFSPVFSPDMRHIAYRASVFKLNRFQLRVVARDAGGKPRVLVNSPDVTYVDPQGWSSNGSILVLIQRADKTWEIALVSSMTGAVTKVKSLDWRIADPLHETSLSRDGQFIAYAALTTNPNAPIRERRDDLERQVYVVRADGTGEVAITSGTGVKRYPVWTPDGSHLLYLSSVGGRWGLWAVPMKNGKPAGPAVLVRNDLGAVAPVGMSAAGGYHYYEGRSGVIRTAIVDLNEARTGQTNPREKVIGEQPSWSPDGQSLVLARADASNAVQMVVRTIATGNERVFSKSSIDSPVFTWFPNSRSLLLGAVDQGQPAWFRADLEGGAIQKLAPVKSERFNAQRNVKALAPDGRTLYSGTSEIDTDEIFSRITALDLTTGTRRDVFRLPIDPDSLPREPQDFAIAISPDGQALALFFRDRKLKRARLATVRVDGTDYRELTDPVDAQYIRTKLVWSRDGKWIYFTSVVPVDFAFLRVATAPHRIMRVPAAGGAVEFTGLTIEGLQRFDISPDGARIAYSTGRPEGDGQLLWSLDVASILRRRTP
jgi:Tol biopolymer transport system component